MNRNIKDIVLCANDISTLDRTSLSLWHFQQLLQPQALVVHNNLSKQELIKQRLSMAEGIIVDENLMIVGLTYEKYTQEKISISHSESNEKEDDQHTLNDPSLEDSIQREDGVLTVNSKVFAIYIKYRCVVCLDASPSALSIDPLTGRLFFDLLCDSLEVCSSSNIFVSRLGLSSLTYSFLLLGF
jgi:hypothetical protein